MTKQLSPVDALQAIEALGRAWHGEGTLTPAALAEIVRCRPENGFLNSLETGCGRSTLLLSHLSQRHISFCLDGSDPGDSYPLVVGSDLLHREVVEFVLGPTQKTVPAHSYDQAGYDFVLLDGPHAYPFPDLEYFHIAHRLRQGGILAIDDIHIPTIYNLYRFLRKDAMYERRCVSGNTAFFTRTAAPAFPQDGDGWETQGYNRRYFPVIHRGNLQHVPGYLAGRLLPAPMTRWLKHWLGR